MGASSTSTLHPLPTTFTLALTPTYSQTLSGQDVRERTEKTAVD